MKRQRLVAELHRAELEMKKRKLSSQASQSSQSQTRKKKRLSVKIGDELKYNDVAITADASTTETVVALTTFAAGDTALTRDGNKILCKSVEFKMNLANEALTQSNTVRFVLVQSMQANAVAPTWFTGAVATDVFDASTVTARRAVPTQSRFRVLWDKTIVVNQMAGTGGGLSQAYIKKFIRLPQVVTTYLDNASGIPVTNAYFLMYVGSTASGATDIDVVGTARVRFVG